MDTKDFRSRVMLNLQDSDEKPTDFEINMLMSIHLYKRFLIVKDINDSINEAKDEIANKHLTSDSEFIEFIDAEELGLKKGTIGYGIDGLPKGQKDPTIINGLKSKDKSVIAYVYYKFYPSIEKYIPKKTEYELTAEDIFQESLIDVIEQFSNPNFNPNDIDEFRPYFLKICTNKWNTFCKKDIARNEVQIDTNRHGIFNIPVNGDEYIPPRLEDAIRFLESRLPNWADIFYFRCYEGVSYEELANELGYKDVDSIKNQKYRCVKELKEWYLNHIKKTSEYAPLIEDMDEEDVINIF